MSGFLLIFVMERFVFIHACEEHECDIHQMGIPAFLGISLHSLLDGVALGAGLLLPQLGAVVLLAVIVHKMPDSRIYKFWYGACQNWLTWEKPEMTPEFLSTLMASSQTKPWSRTRQ
ncbi:MAG: hypothetical protein Q8S00_14485 [Deltaproteobacteria bacterium]|nr:hypothetical protein [Deltaproteobacteria bacterium]